MIETSPEAGIPEIETERLRLRRHRLTDLEGRAAMTGNADTMRFIGGPQDPEENYNRVLRYAGHWALVGYGILLVEERTTGRLLGEAGLADFHRGLGPDFDGFPEAAWIVGSWATGQGYATEAITAAIAWHEQVFGRGRQVCIIDPANGPSLRVAAKLGFAPFREAMFKGHSVLLHERVPAPPQMG